MTKTELEFGDIQIKVIDSESFPYHYNGCDFQDMEGVIADILGFCGCGMPGITIRYVGDALDLLNRRGNITNSYDEWSSKRDEIFPSEKEAYFMWYYLDRMGFAEHGSSVPGWITKKGEDVLMLIIHYRDGNR